MGIKEHANAEVSEHIAALPPPPRPRRPILYWLRDVYFGTTFLARAIAIAFVEPHAGGLQLMAIELPPGVREAVVEVPVLPPGAAPFHGQPHIRLRVALASWIMCMTILCAMSITHGQVPATDISVNVPAPYVSIDQPAEAILRQAAADIEVLGAVVAGINLVAAEPDCEANTV